MSSSKASEIREDPDFQASLAVAQFSYMQFATPARLLMKANVFALLRERNLTHKDLAQFCRKTESWISKIHRDPKKGFPLKYLDRIADFVGVEPYQLLQPGMTASSERRRVQRRRRDDRRRTGSRVLADASPPPTTLPPEAVRHQLDEVMLKLSEVAAAFTKLESSEMPVRARRRRKNGA